MKKNTYLSALFAAVMIIPSVVLAQPRSLPPPQIDRGPSQVNMQLDPSVLDGQNPQDAAETARRLQEKARSIAVKKATDVYLPMETDEIRNFLQRLQDTQAAVQTPLAPVPQADIEVENLSLDPSAQPPVVELAVDNVTSLNLLDVTGQPWPIVDVAFGGAFDVKLPEPGGHIVRITPLKQYASGNISIRLLDFTTPLTFMLQSGTNTVHYRFDARVPEYGPNALLPIISGPGGGLNGSSGINLFAGDRVLTELLEGIIPEEAETLMVSGVDGRTSAYRFGDGIFVRTPHTLLSPSWRSSARSSDGTNVYYVDNTPVLLLSKAGQMVKATLERKPVTNF